MSAIPSAAAAKPAAETDPVRVMVVDDSVVIRGLVSRWIDEDRTMAVVAAHRNGKLAVDDIERSNPDVVILDIEMPELDGLSALPLMLKKKPELAVVMASTLTRRNAEISLKALSLGAADYVPKPESNSGVTTSVDFRRDLVEKVKHLGLRARGRNRRRNMVPAEERPAQARMPAGTPAAPAAKPAGGLTTKPYSRVAPRALVIGSSTGGPQALAEVFQHIGPAMSRVPVLVTQHMPPTFTSILAEHIAKTAARPCSEGEDGEPIVPGRIYIAKGGLHMLVEQAASGPIIRLTDTAPVNFCKPAVDPLFKTASEVFGPALLAAVLTGMGHDGAEGAKFVSEAGGSVVTQDEETSVVWGMPGATAKTGVCSDILPLPQIGPKLARLISGARP